MAKAAFGVNVALEKLCLYMTHLFQEDRVFLRPE